MLLKVEERCWSDVFVLSLLPFWAKVVGPQRDIFRRHAMPSLHIETNVPLIDCISCLSIQVRGDTHAESSDSRGDAGLSIRGP